MDVRRERIDFETSEGSLTVGAHSDGCCSMLVEEDCLENRLCFRRRY